MVAERVPEAAVDSVEPLGRLLRELHPLRLQPLSPGSTTWNDEESRRNFEAIQRVAISGNLKSKLLVHPLEEQAGGDFYHSGGKHFSSQNDAEWQILKAFVLGQAAK